MWFLKNRYYKETHVVFQVIHVDIRKYYQGILLLVLFLHRR